MMNNVYECMTYEVMCYKECVGCYPDFSDREYIFSIVYRMVDSYGTLVSPYFVAQFIRYYCDFEEHTVYCGQLYLFVRNAM
jgi:hypothetical protein